MKISVITPTANRPLAFALCEQMMIRQTLEPDEWIVCDGGTPVECTMQQTHIRDFRPPGARNFAENLLNGIRAASGDLVVVIEDDDWYSPRHIETLRDVANRFPSAYLVGDDTQNYYNLPHRAWRKFQNVGASLCQTAIRHEALPRLERAVQQCLAAGSFGIDGKLWRSVHSQRWALTGQTTVIGIKGLPGQAGLGVGHRPGAGWSPDPELAKLREWIGRDVETYVALMELEA